MWFHRPFRVDEWLMYQQRAISTGASRGLAGGAPVHRRRRAGGQRRAGRPCEVHAVSITIRCTAVAFALMIAGCAGSDDADEPVESGPDITLGTVPDPAATDPAPSEPAQTDPPATDVASRACDHIVDDAHAVARCGSSDTGPVRRRGHAGHHAPGPAARTRGPTARVVDVRAAGRGDRCRRGQPAVRRAEDRNGGRIRRRVRCRGVRHCDRGRSRLHPGRRTGTARPCLPPRGEPRLRQLHQRRRRHRHRRIRRRPGDLRLRPGDLPRGADRRPAVRQPQRRRTRLRTR